MTLYAGEEFRITTSVFDFDGSTALVPADVIDVKITIHSAITATPIILQDAPMTYDSELAQWVYVWNTSGIPTGTYKAKVVVKGLDGGLSWEWKRIRLAKDLVS